MPTSCEWSIPAHSHTTILYMLFPSLSHILYFWCIPFSLIWSIYYLVKCTNSEHHYANSPASCYWTHHKSKCLHQRQPAILSNSYRLLHFRMWCYHAVREVGTWDSEEYDANLKWEAVCPFKMLIPAYQTTQHHIPGDGNLHRHWQDKLKSCIFNSYPPLNLQNQVKKPIQKRKKLLFCVFQTSHFYIEEGKTWG